MLVLQVIVKAKTLGCKMLADHGHPEIGAILAAVALRYRKAEMSGFVGKVFPPSQQRFPFPPRQPAIFKVGARPFAAVIEETDVIIGFFNRLDLARDESVELGEIGDQVGRQCKIQGNSPGGRSCRCREAAKSSAQSIKVRSPSQVKQPKWLFGAEALCVIRWRRRAGAS